MWSQMFVVNMPAHSYGTPFVTVSEVDSIYNLLWHLVYTEDPIHSQACPAKQHQQYANVHMHKPSMQGTHIPLKWLARKQGQ